MPQPSTAAATTNGTRSAGQEVQTAQPRPRDERAPTADSEMGRPRAEEGTLVLLASRPRAQSSLILRMVVSDLLLNCCVYSFCFFDIVNARILESKTEYGEKHDACNDV